MGFTLLGVRDSEKKMQWVCSKNFSQHAKGKMALILSGALGALEGYSHPPPRLQDAWAPFQANLDSWEPSLGSCRVLRCSCSGSGLQKGQSCGGNWWLAPVWLSVWPWVRVTFIICPFPSPPPAPGRGQGLHFAQQCKSRQTVRGAVGPVAGGVSLMNSALRLRESGVRELYRCPSSVGTIARGTMGGKFHPHSRDTHTQSSGNTGAAC